jgi:hypothetical protein
MLIEFFGFVEVTGWAKLAVPSATFFCPPMISLKAPRLLSFLRWKPERACLEPDFSSIRVLPGVSAHVS